MGNSESSSSHSSSRSGTSSAVRSSTTQSSTAAASSSASSGNTAVPAAPGAYKMPGQSRNQRFYVTIPRGVRPNQHFAVLVNGQQMMVRCPEGNRPGERLIVTAPRQQNQQFVVTVPPGVKPGQQFRVMINNQEVMVTCPRGVGPNSRVTFQLPQQDRTQQPQLGNQQMFEVVVPEGVRSGQPFALIASGQRVMVTCPPNVRPGQKIRFQLPIQLSQQQLETIRVNYNKDGWMRCLGQDSKFHWIYNKASTSISPQVERKIHFDLETEAFVSSLNLDEDGQTVLNFDHATDYGSETTVKGTTVNYQELSTAAQLPFQQKVEWLKNQFSALRVPWEDGHIKVKLRRSNLLNDAIDAFDMLEVEDFRKIFRFEFINEPALDAGGVAREFYSVLCEQLFNPDCGLFVNSTVNQSCMHINPNSGIANENHLKFFNLAGRVIGKALMDNQITPVHLVQPMYKHLMGWPITLMDLEHIDHQIYRNLVELLNLDDVEMLYLEFVITEDQLGSAVTVELIPGGTDKIVTNMNLPEYLIANLKYRLMDRIRPQLLQFLKGFYDVVPETLLSVFDFQEVELLLHGLPNIDMNDWIDNTEYTGDFAGMPNHKVVQWFWEIVREFEHEQKAKLLQFVTGTSGVPVTGFQSLQGNDGNIRKFCMHGDKNVKVFPRAHTCFNRIDMPIYKSKAEMSKYLTMAISMESTGFDIE